MGKLIRTIALMSSLVVAHASAQGSDTSTQTKKPDPFTGRYFQKEAQEELRRELAIQAQIEQSKASIESSKAQAAEAAARRRDLESKGVVSSSRSGAPTALPASPVTNSGALGAAKTTQPRSNASATGARIRPPATPIAIAPQIASTPMPPIAPQSVDIATIKFDNGDKVVLSDRAGFVLSSGPSERPVQINVDTRKPVSPPSATPTPASVPASPTSPTPNVSLVDAPMETLIRR